jgi:hypothetical protein
MIKNEDGITMFSLFGIIHRINGPAMISPSICQWVVNGKRHRQDGPALIFISNNGLIGRTEWWLNGSRYRKDGPAISVYFRDGSSFIEEWFIDGIQHKEITYHKNKNIASIIFFSPDGVRIRKHWYNPDSSLDCVKSY